MLYTVVTRLPRQSILISTTRLRWNRTPRIIELLAAASLRGVGITIIIAETGHKESSLEGIGFKILHHPHCKLQCAVIDQHIGWYGSLNLLGLSPADTNVIRMTTSEFANALLECLRLR